MSKKVLMSILLSYGVLTTSGAAFASLSNSEILAVDKINEEEDTEIQQWHFETNEINSSYNEDDFFIIDAEEEDREEEEGAYSIESSNSEPIEEEDHDEPEINFAHAIERRESSEGLDEEEEEEDFFEGKKDLVATKDGVQDDEGQSSDKDEEDMFEVVSEKKSPKRSRCPLCFIQ